MEAICKRASAATSKYNNPVHLRQCGITRNLNSMVIGDVKAGNTRETICRTASGPYFADIIADKAHNFAVMLRHYAVVSGGAIYLSPLSVDTCGIRVKAQYAPQISQLSKRFFESPAQMYMGMGDRKTNDFHEDAFSGISDAVVTAYGAKRSERLMGQLRLEPGVYAVVITGRYSPSTTPEQLVETVCRTFCVENEL